ncbi:hypothetical protein LguiB_001300 [Lonicera macranthoides]
MANKLKEKNANQSPRFLNVSLAFGMTAVAFVSLIESTRSYKVVARFASATLPLAHVLSRGIRSKKFDAARSIRLGLLCYLYD